MTTMPLEIGQEMTPSPLTVGSTQPLALAHRIMRDNRIRHLPVLESGKLVGIVTERDLHLLETLKDVDLDTVRVEEAMSGEPWIVERSTPVAEAVLHMANHKIGAAIVVDGGHVVGVFTTIDALRLLASLLAPAMSSTDRPTPPARRIAPPRAR